MSTPRYPSLYQINTRVWLTGLGRALGREATLDDVPDAELDRWAETGFDWIWLLSVWQTGAAGQRVSRSNPEWRDEFAAHASGPAGIGHRRIGLRDHGVLGLRPTGRRRRAGAVPGAASGARPAPDAGFRPQPHRARSSVGGAAPGVLRRRGPRRTWPASRRTTRACPAPAATSCWPTAAIPTSRAGRTRCSWTTAIRRLQEAMIGELERIAGQCDGVRCDMAMLVLPDVFERTWGRRPPDFWPEATRRVRERHPGFVFMAEVYWDLEWALQQQGFDYTYDKRLYDRLREGQARPGARAFPRRPGLPGPARAFPREPRRASRCCDLRLRRASGCGRRSRSCRRDCASSTRDSSRGAGRGSRPISSAARRSPSTRRCLTSMAGCSPF